MHAGFFALCGICDVIKPRLCPYPRSSLRSRTTEKLRNVTKPRCRSSGGVQLVQKPRRVSPPKRRKKVQSFSSATCAAKKILLGLQTCELSVSADSECDAVRPQTPLSKKQYFFDCHKNPAAEAAGFCWFVVALRALRQCAYRAPENRSACSGRDAAHSR